MSTHELYKWSEERARERIWVFSDLQQSLPELAEDCLSRALADMEAFLPEITRMWYLGDAMEGRDADRTAAMAAMQVEKLGRTGLPLRFVMGNHDLDATSQRPAGTPPVLPTYEAFRKVPGWRTTERFTDFYFTETMGEVLVVFLSDHVAPDNAWIATQHGVRGEAPGSHPHSAADYRLLRQRMAAWRGPVILAGHYAFPGGARGPREGLLERMLPLPDNVALALHGHAHIGDWPYGKAKTFQRAGWIDWHDIPQVNISSLDRTRGSQTRSAVLHLHADGGMGVFFRDHEDAAWSDVFWTDARAPRRRSDASRTYHQRKTDLSDTELHRWQHEQNHGRVR